MASPKYASVPDPRQNEENNRGKKPLLQLVYVFCSAMMHWIFNHCNNLFIVVNNCSRSTLLFSRILVKIFTHAMSKGLLHLWYQRMILHFKGLLVFKNLWVKGSKLKPIMLCCLFMFGCMVSFEESLSK